MSTGASNQYEVIEFARAMVRAAGAAFTNAGGGGLVAGATGTNGITRTSAGLYTLTLAQAAPAASTNLIPTLLGGVNGSIVVEHTSDTVKTIRTFDGADPPVAADFDFDLICRRFAP
jgi:hypothetical protein